ncbi:MAG: SMP-30/gluconolactonase/LRE family protein, partial [Terriglobia bacterium]
MDFSRAQGAAGIMSDEVEILVDDGNLCGEAPIWDADKQQLYWVDSVALKFYRYDWQTRERYLVKEGLQVNGCALDHSGGFVITNDFGIWLWDGGERVQLIVDEVEGSKCRMNDCIADP